MKSSCRRPATQVVIASRAYSGYIEYVGANETTFRPGPPNACRICSITSLEPFAAQICSGATGKPASAVRYAARPPRSSVNSRSG